MTLVCAVVGLMGDDTGATGARLTALGVLPNELMLGMATCAQGQQGHNVCVYRVLK